MRKIYYYYDAVVKSHNNRYYVDYYCTNGKQKVWAGRHMGDSPTAALEFTRSLVNSLNKPRSFFGKICQWFWFMKRIRN